MTQIDLTGNVYGIITIVSYSHFDKDHHWNGKCKCGNDVVAKQKILVSKNKKSCGCLGWNVNTHALTHSSEYEAWHHMKSRCNKPSEKSYMNYGGRGIKVCDRWQDEKRGFVNFIEDIGMKPSKEYTLDRIDNNGNYEPSNCRWATRKEQARNTRQNKYITHAGKTLVVAEWAEYLNTYRQRIESYHSRGRFHILYEKLTTNKI